MRISEALAGMVSAEELARITAAFDKLDYDAAVETVTTAGALSVSKRTTRLSVTGTVAYTLANGTYSGQRKTILCTTVGGSPVGVVTPANLANGDTLTFNAVNDCCELFWDGLTWHVVSNTSVSIG